MTASGTFAESARIPIPLTALVGRDKEFERVVALLSKTDTRLVTLTGPGGVGKTRLALHVLSHLDKQFAQGAALVSLAPVRSPDLVLRTIARSLGIREQAGQSDFDALARSLRERTQLLGLDNLEQVVEVAPLLGELLVVCPGLKLLITSRTRLNIQGEYQVPVPPLALPAPNPRLSLSDLARNESISLFTQRAQQADPGFALDEKNGSAVAAICRRLDGLPLALELAAARLALLTPGALLSRLDDSLHVLTGGPQDQPPRLRSLDDAIAWSYDLLNAEEQALLRHLAVFFGGWTIEAAAHLERHLPGGHPDVLGGLSSLIDKSLLRRMPGHDDREPRFTMLETVREFGLRSLAESGEEHATRAAHADYVLTLAERAEPELDAANQGWWLNLVEIEHDNIRAALRWLHERGEAERGLRLAGTMRRFWDTRDYTTEGRAQLVSMLALPGVADHPAPLAKALGALGELALWLADPDAAEANFERALELWREMENRREIIGALVWLGYTALERNDLAKADAYAGEAVALARQTNDRHGEAMANWVHAMSLWSRGQRNEAERILLASYATMIELEDRSNALWALQELSSLAIALGDVSVALERLEGVLILTYEVGERWCLAVYLEGMALILADLGESELGATMLGAAAAWRKATNAPVLKSVGATGAYEALRERLGEEVYARCIEAGRQYTLDEAVEICRTRANFLNASTSPTALDDAGRFAAFGLTPREIEIVQLLKQRLSDREIAERLFISPRTAGTHVTSILGKLELSSRREVPDFAP
jgi:predicted ATPase/DNA-binding CsgD family transcriptional regulator